MARHIWLFTVILLSSGVMCEECVTYNFENNFEDLFTNENLICAGMQPWELRNYTSSSIDYVNSNSKSFISPNSELSCISSFTFLMEATGVVEANIYMEAKSPNDVVLIMVNMVSPNGIDPVVGSITLSASDAYFVGGWHALRLPLTGVGPYDGYISILGLASDGSTVLLDSFRYIPPLSDEESCVIYENNLEESTADSITDPIIDTTTVEPDANNDNCVAYNFEWDFNNLFNDETDLCDEYLSWNHRNYTSVPVISPNENSELFISPNALPSCIASFVFTMTPQGVVEANVYMEPQSELDHIIVLAKKVVPNGIHTVAGFFMYYPTSDKFVTGWNTLRFSVDDFRPFDGYLTFIGTAAEGSIVLVDSFRYMSPTALDEEESCTIY